MGAISHCELYDRFQYTSTVLAIYLPMRQTLCPCLPTAKPAAPWPSVTGLAFWQVELEITVTAPGFIPDGIPNKSRDGESNQV